MAWVCHEETFSDFFFSFKGAHSSRFREVYAKDTCKVKTWPDDVGCHVPVKWQQLKIVKDEERTI